jgi:hypothetical protein
VHIAEVDNAVIKVTKVASRIMMVMSPMPACPTIHDTRKKIITPKMFKMQRINTPLIHPNFTTSLFLHGELGTLIEVVLLASLLKLGLLGTGKILLFNILW